MEPLKGRVASAVLVLADQQMSTLLTLLQKEDSC